MRKPRPNDNEIMLGLAISASSLHFGQTRTCHDLACFTGLTPQAISLIEHRALRKLRQKLYCAGIEK